MANSGKVGYVALAASFLACAISILAGALAWRASACLGESNAPPVQVADPFEGVNTFLGTTGDGRVVWTAVSLPGALAFRYIRGHGSPDDTLIAIEAGKQGLTPEQVRLYNAAIVRLIADAPRCIRISPKDCEPVEARQDFLLYNLSHGNPRLSHGITEMPR